MKSFDFIITLIIIFFAVFYIYKKYKVNKKSSNFACLGCPYANEGGCSLGKKDKENCDVKDIK
jgi:hypothetical protein